MILYTLVYNILQLYYKVLCDHIVNKYVGTNEAFYMRDLDGGEKGNRSKCTLDSIELAENIPNKKKKYRQNINILF